MVSLLNQKILLVEDDVAQSELLRLILEERGYEVEMAEDGERALKKIENDINIHIVITDLNMPQMDGYGLIKEIRKMEMGYTYIIVLTAAKDDLSRFKALELGADDYLLKPVSPRELELRLAGAERLLKLVSHQNLIFAMAKLAEYRSEETGLHLERVFFYTKSLGRVYVKRHPESGLPLSRVEEIARLSPLHDIGKIAIPDRILSKPGRLSEDEIEIMKTHTTIGGRFIHEMYQRFPTPYLLIAYEIVMYHHEKWDGTGYPEGLKGTEIPISARIVALADYYDAVSTRRCYRDALETEEVRENILREKERHFDPDLVDCFVEIESEFIKIRQEVLGEEPFS